MPKKMFSAEQIMTVLRQIEVLMAQGKSAPESCRDAWISQQNHAMSVLNGEIFYSLKELKIVIEQWRKHYNTIRPQSALNYRPPAPQTFAPRAHHLDEIMPMRISIPLVQKIRRVRA